MRILLYRADGKTEPWVRDFAEVLPGAEMVVWQEGAQESSCDYAVSRNCCKSAIEPCIRSPRCARSLRQRRPSRTYYWSTSQNVR